MVLVGVGCCTYRSGVWKVAIKKPLADLCLAIGAWYYPFNLNCGDQVWPENFGGVKKAPAVDLVSGGYTGVQEDDQCAPASGFLWFQRGFVLKTPGLETLVEHGLRLIIGVFGVLFQLLGIF